MNAQIPNPVSFQSLWDAGYPNLIPVSPVGGRIQPGSSLQPEGMGKAPAKLTRQNTWVGMGGWQNHQATKDDIAAWETWQANIGMQMGAQTVALDVDILDDKLAQKAKEIVLGAYPNAPLRYGRAPKFLALFRVVGEPIPSSRIAIDNGKEGHLVEVLGVGRQAVVWGTHPNTHKPYSWPAGLPPLNELPETTLDKLGAVRSDIIKAAEAMGYRQGVLELDSDADHDSSELGAVSPDPELTAELLADLKNEYTWDGWFRMGLAAAGAKLDAYGEHAFQTFSKGSPKYDHQTTQETYEMCCRISKGRLGAGTIHYRASEQGLVEGKRKARHAQAVNDRRAELDAQRHADEIAEVAEQLPPGWHDEVARQFGALDGALSHGIDRLRAEKFAAHECAPDQAYIKADPPELPSPPKGDQSTQAPLHPSTGGTAPPSGAPGEAFLHSLPPGLVGKLIEYGWHQSYSNTNTLLLGGALACVATTAANRFVVEMPGFSTPLALQIIATAGTGVGKEAMSSLAATDVKLSPYADVFGSFGSPEGFRASLADNAAVQWNGDEFGKQLQYIRANAGNAGNAVLTQVMAAYSKPLETLFGSRVKDAKKSLQSVENPYVVMIQATTPKTLYKGLIEEDLDSGQLNRLLLIQGPKSARKKTKQQRAASKLFLTQGMPQDIADGLKFIREVADQLISPSGQPIGAYSPLTRLYGPNSHKCVPIIPDDEAEALLDEFGVECDDITEQIANEKRAGFTANWARGHENAIRVAGVVALGDWAVMKNPPRQISLTAEHALWGINLSRETALAWEHIVAFELPGSQDAEDEKYILELVGKQAPKHGGWASLKQLNDADFRKIGGDRRRRALTTLLERQEVDEKVEKTGGPKPKKRYRVQVASAPLPVKHPPAQLSDDDDIIGMAPL